MYTQTTLTKTRSPLSVTLACLLLCACSSMKSPQDKAALSNTQTDASIHADYLSYKKQQAAIKTLNDSGKHLVKNYHLAKAQCWLDVSVHEYSRNDRSAFPTEALRESVKITNYLSGDAAPDAPTNPAHPTPLIHQADKLRTDLWDQASQLKTQAHFDCAAQQTACAEVELVHAGNEHKQQGWRHAKPYVQIAEDLLGQAKQAQQACAAKPAAPAPAAPAAAPVAPTAPASSVEKISLSASALFAFNKRNPDDLLATGKAELDQLATKLKNGYAKIDAISLTGYTDRLGSANYNAQLSLDRANTVKAYLQTKGVTAPITTAGKGPNNPVVQCPGKRVTPKLTDCLQPNRRVEVGIVGVKR